MGEKYIRRRNEPLPMTMKEKGQQLKLVHHVGMLKNGPNRKKDILVVSRY
jgi:hypothetical protein